MEQIDQSSDDFQDKQAAAAAAATMDGYNSNVDTSRPFRSVKEAVAIFGEKFLAAEIYNPKTFIFPKQETPYYSPSDHTTRASPHEASWKSSPVNSDDRHSNNDHVLVDALKKLEAELEETKMELKLLKDRESETEVALASLNAELHKNMSKLAQAEADNAATKAVALRSSSKSHGEIIEEIEIKEDNKRSELVKKLEPSSTLAQILSINGGEKKRNNKKVMKKKPIIPLVGDLFSRKKDASTTMHNPLFSYSLN